jgi:hypothetical protein
MFGVELTKLPIEAKEIERAPERTGLESPASETGVS